MIKQRFVVRVVSIGAALVLGGACQSGDDPSSRNDRSSRAALAATQAAPPALHANYNAYASAPTRARVSNVDRDRPGVIASWDDRSGVPSVLWTPRVRVPAGLAGATVEQVARSFANQYATVYGLGGDALATAYVARVHDVGRGVIIVELRQRIGGIDVHRVHMNFAMTRDLSLVAITGSLHPAATPQPQDRAQAAFALTGAQAVTAALGDLYGDSVQQGVNLTELGAAMDGYRHFDLGRGQALVQNRRFRAPARAKPVYFALPDGLAAAYYVELDVTGAAPEPGDSYAYVIAAGSGEVLVRNNLTLADSFDYRVWADTTAPFTPSDGPIDGTATPHPTGMPDGYKPAFVAPNLITMEGFNTNPASAADPWLPAGATETSGNNVHAYADHGGADGFDSGIDTIATTTAANTFDRVYDTAAEPLASTDQIMASVTQIFYVNNWLHDYFYDSGFDEASGNAQADNFGRGGLGGDALLAEAQDTGGALMNNANMATFAEGRSPRMQMYLFSPKVTLVGDDDLEVTAPTSIAGIYPVQRAQFGPIVDTEVTVPGSVVLVDDGTGGATDGCEAIVNNVVGAIALIDRGACSFVQKVLNAQTAGAIAVIIANNDTTNPDDPAPMGGSDSSVTIPAVGVSFNIGATIKGELLGPAVTAVVSRAGQLPATTLDGTLDNGIVAHEWGHYLHHRLAQCGSLQCAGQSEGWGDFLSLHMIVREGDDYDGTYATALYATASRDDYAYYGIRRAPYSTDFTKNGLTFQHIEDGIALPPGAVANSGPNSEVHNAGEVWSSMLFEAYVALLHDTEGSSPRLTFAMARRRMADYIVAGLKLAPVDATFTEQRDAILVAALAADPVDFDVIAAAFARRGVGSGALSPDRYAGGNHSVTEGYSLAGELRAIGTVVAETGANCDNDGVIDAGETGTLTVTVMNGGYAALVDMTVAISSTSADVTFPGGATQSVPTLAPFTSTEMQFLVTLSDTFTGIDAIPLQIELTDPGAVVTPVATDTNVRVNYDEIPSSSATDDVESNLVVWTQDSGVEPVEVWGRQAVTVLDHNWRGVDPGTIADERLVSPELNVSATEDLTIAFDHRYKFEAGGGIMWDGAVIEITSDGGATWQDIGDFVVVTGYGGIIGDGGGGASNPLEGRQGFVDESTGYPATTAVLYNLGTALAGQTVQLRFRVGADQNTGNVGWELDNLAFGGITNTPFAIVVDEPDTCDPEVCDDGIDNDFDTLIDCLDPGCIDAPHCCETNADCDDGLFCNGAETCNATQCQGGTAPTVDDGDSCTFDGCDEFADTVVHTPDPSCDNGGGCGCRAGGGSSSGAPVVMLFGILALVALRRRWT